MKKIITLITIIIFIFLRTDVFAQVTTPAGGATPSAKVEYMLPYPGILPDHPLWFLKAVRDRIIGILITDPLKKAEFNLLQADKRLNAGVALLEKDKNELALSAISKGENYFEQAVSQIKVAKDKGQDTKPLLEKIQLSAKKHQEILQDFKTRVGKDLEERAEKELNRVKSFEKSVEQLSK